MYFIKKYFFLLVSLTFALIFGIMYMIDRKDSQTVYTVGGVTQEVSANAGSEPIGNAASYTPNTIKVYVTGEVNMPGVYELSEDARIDDAIKAAGGTTEVADISRINLAARMADADKIVIPRVGDTGTAQAEQRAQVVDDGLIDINTADVSELERLPGIGETIAQSIIAYRKENGGFKDKEEIKNVTRIGDKTYERIKDLIKVQ